MSGGARGGPRDVPVLDIGGSHVSAAWVDTVAWTVDGARTATRALAPTGTVGELVRGVAAAAAELGDLRGHRLTAAVPGPFDYAAGIARYEGVGKFEALAGVDLRAALVAALPDPPDEMAFLNDATAFALGEWVAGAAVGTHRVIGITLGTGVGSGFLVDGQPVETGPTVPPDAELHLTTIDGQPLEDLVSTRAIVRRYGHGATGVLDVLVAARAGDRTARTVLDRAFTTLGRALAPWVRAFGADAVVVGGKIASAWPEIHGPIADGLGGEVSRVVLVPAANPSTAAEVGAAWFGRDRVARDYHDEHPVPPDARTEVTMTEPDPTPADQVEDDTDGIGIKGAAKKVRDAAVDARTATADKLRDGFDKVIDTLDSLSSKKEQ